MDIINWYDWIISTNPYASIIFGVIFTIILAFIVWVGTREMKTTLVTFFSGVCVTVIGVITLNPTGFYV